MTTSDVLRLAAAFALALGPLACGGAPDEAPDRPVTESVLRPAVEGILEAFETHPLVGLSDEHGLAQEMAFYREIVRHPRFARDVGNVVVEFGAAGRQDVIDRYVAGEMVPYAELRTVWTDTIGWIPTAGLLGFAEFFATVRTTNKALPPAERIRVWLGDPPIDWSAVESRGSIKPAMRMRDSHPASLITEHILARNEKALVIYGGFHFLDPAPYMLGPLPTPFMLASLRSLVEARHPGVFFIVWPYGERHRPASCAGFLEQASRAWPTPALAAPARGGAPEAILRECATVDQAEWVARGLLTISGIKPSKVRGDAVLFLGPIDDFTRSPMLPDVFLDAEYRLEVDRRFRIQMQQPLFPLPEDSSLRRADYEVDLDAPGYAELLEAMFAEHDRNGDGIVTAGEYADPIRR